MDPPDPVTNHFAHFFFTFPNGGTIPYSARPGTAECALTSCQEIPSYRDGDITLVQTRRLHSTPEAKAATDSHSQV